MNIIMMRKKKKLDLISILLVFPVFSPLFFQILFFSDVYGRDIRSREKMCEEGIASECYELAKEYEQKGDYKKAIYYYDSACVFGSGEACVKLSVVFGRGLWGVEKSAENIKKSVFYTEKAIAYLGDEKKFQRMLCDMGYATGCLNLGMKLERELQMKEEAKTFYKKALDIAERECESGEGAGCMTLAYMLTYGVGTSKNVRKGVQFYRRGCELKHGPSCYALAYFYKDGKFAEKSEEKWRELMEKACEYGTPNACYSLWKETEDEKFLKKACYLGHKTACEKLAEQGSRETSP